MSFNADIRSFSSYTQGLHTISGITFSDKYAKLKLRLPVNFEPKLEKRFKKYKCSALSIDGVYAKVSFIKPNVDPDYFEIVAKVAKDVFEETTLADLQCGAQVNVGMLSTNPEKRLLDSSPKEKVKLVKTEIAKVHLDSRVLTFECSKVIFAKIQGLQYIGLNASGLTLRDTYILGACYFFTVHIGRQTREITVFGTDPSPGTQFTLTLPDIL